MASIGMQIMQTLFRGLLLSAVFVLTVRADEFSTNIVDFQKVGINRRPARMILITSLSTSLLLEPGAKRLGLKSTGFSGLTQVSSGGQSFEAPILVFEDPLKEVPWLYRQLIALSHPVLYHQFKKLYVQMTMGLEGVVGWPEVRDNILVFDAGQRTIRRVEQLPPETSGWLKLKVVPSRCLLLELPLADGGTGTVWVDTADRRSVLLPSAQWKQWVAAHPQAHLTSREAIGLPLAITSHYEAQADEIKLGPLTLANVEIGDMPVGKVHDLLRETPTHKTAWVLGMGALTRMDLVVDGKNGWAYVHPKQPDPAAKHPAGGNWTVAENVRLGGDNFFIYRGEYEWSTNGFTGALADFNRALELNPRNADALSDRGVVREIRGNYSDAVADYDKVIELRPDYSDWERLYRQTLLWRLDKPPEEEPKTVAAGQGTSEAAGVLKPVVVYGVQPQWKDNWAKTLGLYLVGRLDEKALLAAAKKSDDSAAERKAMAYYYIGMTHLGKGDKAGAREWFKKCRAAGQTDDNEYGFASAELARLSTAAPR
jgi:hypothetical protein